MAEHVNQYDSSPGNPRPTTLKRINMRRFLEELRRRGPSSRADLTRVIGVTPPTSSAIIADLMATGLLEETDATSTGKGRPGKVFRLAKESAYVIGMTIDIHECTSAPASLEAEFAADQVLSFVTPRDYGQLLGEIAETVRWIRSSRPGNCLGVGLAVPGLVAEQEGRVAFSPNLHFLDGQSLARDVIEATGLNVVCSQEEHALSLSEQYKGSAKNLTEFAVVDFSSGVGMGVFSRGRYISGKDGFAGEIGHTTVQPGGRPCGCGNQGCLETVASDLALVRLAGERVGISDFEDLAREYERGNAELERCVDETLDYIAIGLATVVNLFNPATLFLHGKVFRLGPNVLPKLSGKLEARALGPSVEALDLQLASGTKLHGSVVGMLNRLFAAVGPVLD
jgi:predicted NBD/HSP70 family sugar kinase